MLRLVAQAFRGFLVASAFFFFWAGAVVLTWTLCPLVLLTVRDERRRWHACQRVVRVAFGWFHEYMRVLTLLEATVVPPTSADFGGSDAARERQAPLVFVANHPTLVDVTAILARSEGLCCVVKAGLIRSVFVGRLLRACGHIDGGDGGPMSGAAVMQEALRRLEAGMSVLVFPEGTRSPPGGLHAFRRGAFEIAARAGVPVRPLVLTCNPPALSKGVPFWRQPERMARLRIHAAPTLQVSDARAACVAVESSYRQRLGIAPLDPVGAAPPRSAASPRPRPTPVPEVAARGESPGSP
jgi:1-acyl-sn-glycerol-3-phosphate acyltransferase